MPVMLSCSPQFTVVGPGVQPVDIVAVSGGAAETFGFQVGANGALDFGIYLLTLR